jgi:hypothetical protein
VLADATPTTHLANRAPVLMLANSSPTTLSANCSDPSVFAHASSPAVPARGPHPIMGAYAASPALLAQWFLPSMFANPLAATFSTPISDATVGTNACPTAVPARCFLAVVMTALVWVFLLRYSGARHHAHSIESVVYYRHKKIHAACGAFATCGRQSLGPPALTSFNKDIN